MKASATGFTRSPGEPQPDIVVQMNRNEAAELAASLERCVSCLLGGHRHPNAEKTLQLLDALKLVLERPPEISRSTKPSTGKSGTNGCFVVEVVAAGHDQHRLVVAAGHDQHRLLARRFVTLAEAEEFHTRSVGAHQAKADRERKSYVINLYETTTVRSTEHTCDHRSTKVEPR